MSPYRIPAPLDADTIRPLDDDRRTVLGLFWALVVDWLLCAIRAAMALNQRDVSSEAFAASIGTIVLFVIFARVAREVRECPSPGPRVAGATLDADGGR